MTPRIQLDENTLQMLKEIKKETKAKSIDEVIKNLIVERKKIAQSMFGSNPKLSSFSEKDEAEFHDIELYYRCIRVDRIF